METEIEHYKYLAGQYNYSTRQTGWLYDMCDRDLVKLELFLSKHYRMVGVPVPDTKEELNQFLLA